jgi:hypothetical protein
MLITKGEIIVSVLVGGVLHHYDVNPFLGLTVIPVIKAVKLKMEYQNKRNILFSTFRLIKQFVIDKDFKGSFGFLIGLELIALCSKLPHWIVLLSYPLDLIRYNLYHQYRISKMVKKCMDNYPNREIKIIDNIKDTLVINSKVPISDKKLKENFELITSSTIISITQHLKRKHIFYINHKTGLVKDYRLKEVNSEERLTEILKILGDDKPIFVDLKHEETEDIFSYITKLGKKKLLRSLSDIEVKLGSKKGSLTITFDNEKTVFTIKHALTKQYYLDNVITDTKRPDNMRLPFIMGINRKTGKPVTYDYDKINHMLLAAMTGGCKSSIVHAWIYSLLFWNDNVVCYMFDFKGTELPNVYGGFKNCKVWSIIDQIDEIDSLNGILEGFNELNQEYRRRVKLFSDAGVKDIVGYNALGNDLPYILCVIDEANYLKEFLLKTHKDMFNQIEAILNNLFARCRSTGIKKLYTVQGVGDPVFPIAWRRAMAFKGCGKLEEEKQVEMLLGNNEELINEGFNQNPGEYIIRDALNVCYKLTNPRVNDNLIDQTYLALEDKYSNGGGDNVVEILQKKVETG